MIFKWWCKNISIKWVYDWRTGRFFLVISNQFQVRIKVSLDWFITQLGESKMGWPWDRSLASGFQTLQLLVLRDIWVASCNYYFNTFLDFFPSYRNLSKCELSRISIERPNFWKFSIEHLRPNNLLHLNENPALRFY